MSIAIPAKGALYISICFIALNVGVAQQSGIYLEEDLKLWQRYVDNEQSLATGRILSQKGLSFITALRELYNLTKLYSTCRSQNIQFDDTDTFHSVWTVCSRLQVSVLSSTNKYMLEIRTPTVFGLNITALEFRSDSNQEHVCWSKAMLIQYGKNDWELMICGSPYLGRTSLVAHHNAMVGFSHQYHKESVLKVSLHIQVASVLGKSISISSIQSVTKTHIFPPTLQSRHGKIYGSNVVILTSSYNSLGRVPGYVPEVHIMPSNCSQGASFAVYDGPYAGVLSTTGLLSPFQLLMEGLCEDVTTNYVSSIGDLTVVMTSPFYQNPDATTICKFRYIPASCPGKSCIITTVDVDHDNLQMWSSIVPRRPLIQIIEFHAKTPDSYINLKLEVTEADVPHPSGYRCHTEGIFMYEFRRLMAFACSGQGFSNLNRSMQENGTLQFNTIPVTITLKIYPQTTKLKLNVWYIGTSCFGLVNGCLNITKPFLLAFLYNNWGKYIGRSSCRPYFDVTKSQPKTLNVHLKHHCCFQWHMLEYDESLRFPEQCASNFYAHQNGLYQWHIALDEKQKRHGCLKVKYAATDYPLMYVSRGLGDDGPLRTGVFVLEKSISLISAYVHMQIHKLDNCFPLTMGLKVTGIALNTPPFYCSTANISYGGDSLEEPLEVFFMFKPFHPCAEVYFSALPIRYYFSFNRYELKNTPYNFRRGRCCFVNLVLQERPTVKGELKNMLRYTVTNEKRCNSSIIYTGIPQSLVLRDFHSNTFSEAFEIAKWANTPSFSVQYYFRGRTKVQIHSSIYTSNYKCSNGACALCTSRKCYNIYGYNSPGTFTWNQANMICRHNGSNLLSINDQYEWSSIAQLLEVLCFNVFFVHLGLEIRVCLLSRYVVNPASVSGRVLLRFSSD